MRSLSHPALWVLPVLFWLPSAGAEPSACRQTDWAQVPRQLPLLLGSAQVWRGKQYITGFSLDSVAKTPAAVGRGGITGEDDALRRALGNCSDSASTPPATAGTRHEDTKTGLVVEVTQVEPAGKSGRGWAGVRCSFRVSAREDPSLHGELGADTVPAFSEVSGLTRAGTVAYLTLQFNGYAKEIQNRGNLVVALDLCAHRVAWRSRDLVSNAALLQHRDYLITGYGFTRERAFLFVLNRWTGTPVQQILLPKSPSDLRLQDDTLFVRLYDGYAAFPLLVK